LRGAKGKEGKKKEKPHVLPTIIEQKGGKERRKEEREGGGQGPLFREKKEGRLPGFLKEGKKRGREKKRGKGGQHGSPNPNPKREQKGGGKKKKKGG